MDTIAVEYQKLSDRLRLEYASTTAMSNRPKHEFYDPDINVHFAPPFIISQFYSLKNTSKPTESHLARQ
jgi:hypothetical protein